MSKAVLTFFIILCLLSTMFRTGLASNINTVKAIGTIYIRDDGSIDPPTVNLTRDGAIYTFAGNIYDSIVVQRSDIIVDGNGYTLEGSDPTGSENGFFLSCVNNVTIRNTCIRDFRYGVYLNASSNNTVSGNKLISDGCGVYLRSSCNNCICGNNVTNNLYFSIFFYWFSDNNNVCGNKVTHNRDGFGFVYSSGNTVSGNNITELGFYAFKLSRFSSNNNISDNNIVDNGDMGVWMHLSSNGNTISRNNIIANNAHGVYLDESSNNTISANNITANGFNGIQLSYSSNTTICGNNVTANNVNGISLYRSSNNSIYHNIFESNAKHQAATYESVNVWDDGYPSGGNYWGDYVGADLFAGSYQNKSGSDGIGDSAYVINGENQDNYPLMGVFSDFNVDWQEEPYRVNVVSNSTVSNFEFREIDHMKTGKSWREICFDVAGENGTLGFCRICIPTALMNGTYKVFVNGKEVPHALLSCSNRTHSYLYFTYEHSTKEVVIVPEFPLALILPLLVVFTFAAVVFSKKKRRCVHEQGIA